MIADSEEKAADLIRNAKSVSEAQAAEAKQKTQDEARLLLDNARKEIEAQKDAALKSLKEEVATIAVAAARDVIAKQMTASDGNALIDDAIANTKTERVGFEGYFAALADTLTGRPSKAVTLEEGAASIELVTAIYHAARSGQRVPLPLGPDHPLYAGWQP